MKQFTSEEIQAIFEKLPTEVLEAITSSDVNEKVESIGKKYNLHIDQLGELVDEVGLVMLGLQKSSLFVSDLCDRLSIDRKIADNITADITKDVISLIRKHLMSVETTSSPSDLERLGDFTIDHTQTANNDKSPIGDVNGNGGVPTERRSEILSGIEDPDSIKMPTRPRIEPLTDHLLTTPITIPPQQINQPQKLDPYKESLN